MEEYPSPVEGIGLENREVVKAAQGFESLFLRQFYFYFISRDRAVVARWAHNPEVVGSNPSPATNWSVSAVAYHVCLSRRRSRVRIPYRPPFGSLAQSVEQGTENPCVGGSIPLGATIIIKTRTVEL